MGNTVAFEAEPGVMGGARRAFSVVMGWLGAACSIALVCGLGWWAVDLALRDANGVPVVRAMAGPARVAPESPGGFEVAHQGLAVNSIASEEPVEPLSERIALAPATVKVAPDDLSIREQQDQTAETAANIAPIVPAPEAADAAPEPESFEDAMRASIASALEEVLGQDDTQMEPSTNPLEELEPEARLAPLGPGLPNSPRPSVRPGMDFVTRGQAQVVLASAVQAPTQFDPASIAPGTRLVQLGAYETADIAAAERDRLHAKFADYMASKSLVIEPARVNNRTFYRLRAVGFEDLAEARNFCSALIAEQADCIPVLTR